MYCYVEKYFETQKTRIGKNFIWNQSKAAFFFYENILLKARALRLFLNFGFAGQQEFCF